ncbi:MAG: polysaccharide deacetylase family protein [Alicyclobacillus sp.]|nr:polysaccharide deacetylase family protein [Alicyclobacillus sp.]
MKRAHRVFTGILGVGALIASITGCAPNQQTTAAKPKTLPPQAVAVAVHRSSSSPNPVVNVQPLDMHHLNVDLSHQVYYRNKVVVVTFHDISPRVYSSFVITPQQFDADLNAIHEHFNVITNQQFINFLDHRGSVPPNAVLLTFDDGYRDMYTYALPALVQHEMQGTFFDIVGSMDSKIHGEFLKLYQIQQMAHDGMVFESHTYQSHYEVKGPNGKLTPVFDTRIVVDGKLETPSQYYHRVYSDFVQARTELSRVTGHPVTEFAWPYGYGTPMATYIANKAGYQFLFTTNNGYVSPYSNHDYLHRIDIGRPYITPAEAVQAIIDTANPPTGIYRMPHRTEKAGHPGGTGHVNQAGRAGGTAGSTTNRTPSTAKSSEPKTQTSPNNAVVPGTSKV